MELASIPLRPTLGSGPSAARRVAPAPGAAAAAFYLAMQQQREALRVAAMPGSRHWIA